MKDFSTHYCNLQHLYNSSHKSWDLGTQPRDPGTPPTDPGTQPRQPDTLPRDPRLSSHSPRFVASRGPKEGNIGGKVAL